MAEQEQKTKDEVVYFMIGSKRAKWETPDGAIQLSIFNGKKYGKVNKNDDIHYPLVLAAIQAGFLLETKKEIKSSSDDKETLINVTDIADDRVKHRRDAQQVLKKLHKDELMEKIQTIKNPYLIAAMIEQESRGRNVSTRRREDGVKVLKSKLDELGKNIKGYAAMFQYSEETNEGFKLTREDDTDNSKSSKNEEGKDF